jgi:BMFP domain-containing protein YqiC
VQHAHREVHAFSSTTTEVLISEVEINWMLTPLRATSAEYQPIGALAAFSDIFLRWLGKGVGRDRRAPGGLLCPASRKAKTLRRRMRCLPRIGRLPAFSQSKSVRQPNRVLGSLDEEYDVQTQVLARAREKLSALEARIAELEARPTSSRSG